MEPSSPRLAIDSAVTVKLGLGDSIVLEDVDRWRMDAPITVNGGVMSVAKTITASEVAIQVTATPVWQNFVQPSDINNDGIVSALDSLQVINELSRRSFSSPLGELITAPQDWPDIYFDHTGPATP